MNDWFPDGTALRRAEATAPRPGFAPVRASGLLTVSIATPEEMLRWLPGWRGLARRAAEPNPFYSPDIALAAMQHLREGAGLRFLLVRDSREPDPAQALLALLPLRQPRLTLGGPSVVNWRNPYFAFGAPLVDALRAEAALEAALGFLSLHWSDEGSLALRDIPDGGPLALAACRAATRLGLETRIVNRTARAMLSLESEGAEGACERKRRKELRRLGRRLAERGAVSFSLSADYLSFKTALEDFLALEAAGWKGARGSALLTEPGRASFARAALWGLAERGEARVATLSLGGASIASTILIEAAGDGFLWKIAYDEAFASFGPGVLLIDALGAWARRVGELRRIDSCALEGNRMIESLWPGRRALCDVIIALSDADAATFERALAREAQFRRWRGAAKSLYRRLRGGMGAASA